MSQAVCGHIIRVRWEELEQVRDRGGAGLLFVQQFYFPASEEKRLYDAAVLGK